MFLEIGSVGFGLGASVGLSSAKPEEKHSDLEYYGATGSGKVTFGPVGLEGAVRDPGDEWFWEPSGGFGSLHRVGPNLSFDVTEISPLVGGKTPILRL